MNDSLKLLNEQITNAYHDNTKLTITSGNSKNFLVPDKTTVDIISATNHTGIVEYLPEELVITVRAGTSLVEINNALNENNQMLAFEPEDFGNSTIGGTVAAAISGHSAGFYGLIHDFILGLNIINGRGEYCRFGGKVMKNVAGYDVSRFLTGSYGSMALICEISLKIVPKFTYNQSYQIITDNPYEEMQKLKQQQQSLSALLYQDGVISYRLSSNAKNNSSDTEIDSEFWNQINTNKLGDNVFRLMSTKNTANIDGIIRTDLGGLRHWIIIEQQQKLDQVSQFGKVLAWSKSPLIINEPLLSLKQKLNLAFDPKNIFNSKTLVDKKDA